MDGGADNLALTHSFVDDFLVHDPFANNFAFVRLGSHESAIYLGNRSTKNAVRTFRRAVESRVAGYHVGIPCPDCHQEVHEKLSRSIKVPASRVTYDNVLADDNHERFKMKYYSVRHHITIVAPSDAADVVLPPDVDFGWDYRHVLKQMRESTKPIFVAAGPISTVLIHEYWTKTSNPQTIMDVGSTIDPLIYGKTTKEYHDENYPASQRVCQWSTHGQMENGGPFSYL